MVADIAESSPPLLSPSSAESSFRQIDDVFLQTQMRVWLGEVLQTRLNEQHSIADLLADGELLFEVSREIWKMMLTKNTELSTVKAYECEPFASKNIGRYMPYSNVDSFLKICKILGLAGIDLFSPSDIVEKRDTRKVCMCVRALSKKARSRHLNVPDFDIVTYTVAMPTDMVGYIRRSWELVHSAYSSSSSHSGHPELRQRSRQKLSNAKYGSCNTYFDKSDDIESNFMLQSDSCASISSYNSFSQISCNLINSPGESSIVKNDFFDQRSVQLDIQNQLGDECIQCQQEATHLNKLTRSLFAHDLEYDHLQDNITSPSSVDSNTQRGGRIFSAESRVTNSHKSVIQDWVCKDPSMEDVALGDSVEWRAPRINFIDDPPRTLENEFRSRYLDGDNIEVSSAARVSPVSSIASVSSISVAPWKLDFDDHLDTDDVFRNDWSPELANGKLVGLSNDQTDGSKSKNMVEYGTPGLKLITNDEEESLFDMKGMDIGFSSQKHVMVGFDKYTARHLDHAISCDKAYGEEKELFASLFYFGFPQWDQKGKSQIIVEPIGDDGRGSLSLSVASVDSHEENLQPVQAKVTEDALGLKNIKYIVIDHDKEVHTIAMVKSDLDAGKQRDKCCPIACFDNIMERKHENSNASCNVVVKAKSEIANQDEGENGKFQMSTLENSGGTNSPVIGTAERKPQKRPFLKSVVKGTAVVGGLLLLLHFRKNHRQKIGGSDKLSYSARNVNGGDFSSAQGQTAHTGERVYPAEKLKL